MRSQTIHEKARRIAQRAYAVHLMRDLSVDGRTVYVAGHPELPGCVADGDTAEEALSNLRVAAVEFIASLIEDGLAVPPPNCAETETSLGDTSEGTTTYVDIAAGTSPAHDNSEPSPMAGGTVYPIRV